MASELVLLEQWRERLKRQSESGLTVEAFCQKEGVSTSMFYKWQRHLRETSPLPMSTDVAGTGQRTGKKRSQGPRRQRPKAATTSVAASEQPSEFLQLPVRSVRSMPWIELTLVDGTVVRIPQENHAALATVLRILQPEGRGPLAEALHA